MSFADDRYKDASRDNYLEQIIEGFDETYRVSIARQYTDVLWNAMFMIETPDSRVEDLIGRFKEWICYVDYTIQTPDGEWDKERELLTSLLTLVHDVGWENNVHPHFDTVDEFMDISGFNN